MDNPVDQIAGTALQAALNGDWMAAAKLNQQILSFEPQNLEALKRLAKAYLELGKTDTARELYQQILIIDPYDQIAKKLLNRLQYLNGTPPLNKTSALFSINFIEEPGITKTTQLVEICESCIIATLNHGEPVHLTPRKRQLCAYSTASNQYIGKLSEDLSQRLITLLQGGNQYQAWIKTANPPIVRIFIKETFRAPQFSTILSFPDSQVSYLAFTDPNLVYYDRPYTKATEEQK